jgi:transcriptional regulator with XRE-family HTH domain
MDIPTDRQIRAARALLGWTQIELAERAVVAETVVKRVESGRAVRSAMLRAICDALADAGISFTANDGEYGVRIARAASGGATITTGAGRSEAPSPRPPRRTREARPG